MTQLKPLSIIIHNQIDQTKEIITLEPNQTLVVGRTPASGLPQMIKLDQRSVTADHQYVLTSDFVSQRHLVIHYSIDGRIQVIDPGSKNGTLAPLTPGSMRDVERGTRMTIPNAADIVLGVAEDGSASLIKVAACKGPDALAELVRQQLRDHAESVRVVRDDQQPGALSSRTERFSLWPAGQSLLVTWSATRTRLTGDTWWLMECLARYNARSSTSARPAADSGSWRFVARSPLRLKLLNVIKDVAPSPVSILLVGDTGVGKSMLAHEIHAHSMVARGPFRHTHIGTLNESLIEAALFGVEKGAYTGATLRKEGFIEQANGGTLFLDEIDKLPLSVQYKLLDVLDRGVIRRVGGQRDIQVHFRLIAAANADLKHKAERGEYSRELYYRIACACLRVPPMEREDIEALVPQLLDELRQERNGFSAAGLPPNNPSEVQLLISYALNRECKGGVRELERTLRLYLTFRQANASVEEAWRNAMLYGPRMEAQAAAEELPKSSSEPEVARSSSSEAWTPHGKDQLRHALHLLGDLMFLQEVRRAVRHPEPDRSMLTVIASGLGFTKTAVSQRLNKKYKWEQIPTQDMLDAETERVRQQLMPYADRLIAAIQLLVPGSRLPPWHLPLPPAAADEEGAEPESQEGFAAHELGTLDDK